MGYRFQGDYPRYIRVADRKAAVARRLAELRAQGLELNPVQVETGRGRLGRGYWARSFCDQMERFPGLATRLASARRYVRHGAVVDLRLRPGRLEGLVSGTQLYRCWVEVAPLDRQRWHYLTWWFHGQLSSLDALLQGRLSPEQRALLSDRSWGLLPREEELRFECTCPDQALMCKHVLALLLAAGVQLDTHPGLVFMLRQVNPNELITGAPDDGPAVDLGPLFGHPSLH